MTLALRDYQRQAVDSLFEYFELKSGSPIVCMPTGSGKSLIQSAFISEAVAKYPETRFLCLTHVKELLSQNSSTISRMCPGLSVGIYSAGLNRRELGYQVTVAGIQSIYKRAADVGAISLVMVDECHLIPSKGLGRYRQFLADLKAINPHVKLIGLSATPFRLDSGLLTDGDGAMFTDIAYDCDILGLVKQGYLCPLNSRGGKAKADLSAVHVRGGEFVPGELEAAVDKEAIVRAACAEIVERCANRNKWLIFCAGVAHAHHVAEELRSHGVECATVTGETPSEERAEILRKFKLGFIRAITNVNVLTTGFDQPDIDALIMLRPTMSPVLYVQSIGRGMRPHSSKTDTLVLDFAGNIVRHGPVDAVRIQGRVAGAGDEPGEAPCKECPECQAIVPAGLRECACGYQFPLNEKPKHDAHAADADIMSDPDKSQINIYEVTGVDYRRHEKPGKPPSMRVIYSCGSLLDFSEWVCFEHGGYVTDKARRWWATRTTDSMPTPDNTWRALELAPSLAVPKSITVDESGKYPRVIGCHGFSGARQQHLKLVAG